MSGVWVFKNNGVMQLVENPGDRHGQGNGGGDGSRGSRGSGGGGGGASSKRKVLVHLPTGEVVSSYSFLEQVLKGLGWERYYEGDVDLLQFHKPCSIDLISLPKQFTKFNSIHMYDIVVKNPNVFRVRDH